MRQIHLKGDHWDDLRVSVASTTEEGTNPPSHGKFQDNGDLSASGNSILFTDGFTSELNIPHNDAYNVSGQYNDGTFEMWFFIPLDAPSSLTLVRRDTTWGVWLNANDHLTTWVHGVAQIQTNNPIVRGQWNHLSVSLYTIPSQANIKTYVNGTFQSWAQAGVGIATSTNAIRVNYTHDAWYVDQVAWWDGERSQAQVQAQWNEGNGNELVGNEANLQSVWKLNDGSGTTATDDGPLGNDATLQGTEDTDFSWDDGIVGGTNTSHGIHLRYFSADVRQELFFEVQLPHSWKEGSNIKPHIHWTPIEAGGVGERVRWGLEYEWTVVGGIFGNTTIVYANDNHLSEDLIPNKHYISPFSAIVGTGKKVSSMLICRVFRDAEDAGDTFGGLAGFFEIDFHYLKDSHGSEGEYSKTH